MKNDAHTLLESLQNALQENSSFNKADQSPPEVVLWTDEAAAWQVLVKQLALNLPILTLGEYNPETQTGPSIWLRYQVAQLQKANPKVIPIVYLPKVSRASFRSIEDCPLPLQPLMAYQYSGVFFAHKNGKDWTISSFLAYLEIQVEADQSTKTALQIALPQLALETVAILRSRGRLHAAALNQLLNPDPERRLLEWLTNPVLLEQTLLKTDGAWQAFLATCRVDFLFDPTEGILEGAKLLAGQQKRWKNVWQRFLDVPMVFAPIANLLEQAKQPGRGLFDFDPLTYPQDNALAEQELRDSLLALESVTVPEARIQLLALEKKHMVRRTGVWAKLGKSPLALQLEPLARLARLTETSLGHGTPQMLAERYADSNWQTDAAALDALALAMSPENQKAVAIALNAIYRPWLEQAALAFQASVAEHGYPKSPVTEITQQSCMVFVDGLRFDVAKQLTKQLEYSGCIVQVQWRFSSIPSVTDTAKPAISPVAQQLGAATDFKAEYKGKKVTAEVLRQALTEAGISVLQNQDLTATNQGWLELGDLDSLAHNQGTGFVLQLEQRLQLMSQQIMALFKAGWSEIQLVTDHGWLLLPNGLPKTELPEHLTEARKGRCARLKPASQTTLQTLPWHFDSSVMIALAPGISVFVAGRDYEHGGLSVQECVTPVLRISQAVQKKPVKISNMRWKGLRLGFDVGGDFPIDTILELRIGQQIILQKTHVQPMVSVMVEDDSWLGETVTLVLLSQNQVICKTSTIIGGE